MIIDTDKVKDILFNKSISYRQIQKETGFSKGMLSRYRTGQMPVDKMRIMDAKKLQDMYDRLN